MKLDDVCPLGSVIVILTMALNSCHSENAAVPPSSETAVTRKQGVGSAPAQGPPTTSTQREEVARPAHATKADTQTPCPAGVESGSSGGACLEPAVLGRQQVDSCFAYLEGKRWTKDVETAKAISQQTGKSIICYARP